MLHSMLQIKIALPFENLENVPKAFSSIFSFVFRYVMTQFNYRWTFFVKIVIDVNSATTPMLRGSNQQLAKNLIQRPSLYCRRRHDSDQAAKREIMFFVTRFERKIFALEAYQFKTCQISFLFSSFFWITYKQISVCSFQLGEPQKCS